MRTDTKTDGPTAVGASGLFRPERVHGISIEAFYRNFDELWSKGITSVFVVPEHMIAQGMDRQEALDLVASWVKDRNDGELSAQESTDV